MTLNKRIERIVIMDPFPKERPRVVRGRAHMTSKYKSRRQELRALFGDIPELTGPTRLTVFAYRAVPKSISKKNARKRAGNWCTAGGDADNIGGAVMDSLFEEDRDIVSLFVERRWSERSDRKGYIKIIIEPA